MHSQELLNEVNYSSYSAQRQYSPEISPERWKLIFGSSVDEMEKRYQESLASTTQELYEAYGEFIMRRLNQFNEAELCN